MSSILSGTFHPQQKSPLRMAPPPHLPLTSLRHEAIAAFAAMFGEAPDALAAAPGRVNLIGEHTDYSGGYVLPIAIDRACIAAARAIPGGTWRFRSTHGGGDSVCGGPMDAHEASKTLPPWSMYPVGVAMLLAAQAADEGRAIPGGLDVLIHSDVPSGGGLSSSAALEVSTALALCAAWSLPVNSLNLARLCRRAEHEFAGVPCGLMDQFASLHGHAGHAMLLDCRAESAEQVPLPPPEQAVFVVCNSHVRHELSGGEYAERRAWCTSAAVALGVPTLRDATWDSLERPHRRFSPDERFAAEHVVSENIRTVECARLLIDAHAAGWPADLLAAFGEHMTESHRSLRERLRVSCAELDTLVELALDTPGVWGSRMTGGGFGGCTVTLVDASRAAALCDRLRSGFRERHGRECSVFTAIASDGARLLR